MLSRGPRPEEFTSLAALSMLKRQFTCSRPFTGCLILCVHPKQKSFFQERKFFLLELMPNNWDLRDFTVRFTMRVWGLIAFFKAVPVCPIQLNSATKYSDSMEMQAYSLNLLILLSSKARTCLSCWITTTALTVGKILKFSEYGQEKNAILLIRYLRLKAVRLSLQHWNSLLKNTQFKNSQTMPPQWFISTIKGAWGAWLP